MPRIPLFPIAAIATAQSVRELQPHLQGILELKHTVIPLYLTALFSIRDRANKAIREILHCALVDEMLHVALIANILNATGCPPILTGRGLVRSYPARLPLDASGIELGLKKFSPELVRDVFMTLDTPDAPVHSSLDRFAADRSHGTISQFYRAIIEKFDEFGGSVFVGKSALQFVDSVSYSERELFRVSDAASAIRALRLVAGEDNTRSRRLQQLACCGAGDDVPFDPADVIDLVENSRAAMYTPGSPARAAIDAFNSTYCSLLAALNEAFNGRPERYEFAVSSMYLSLIHI